jgi:hypothetical protein
MIPTLPTANQVRRPWYRPSLTVQIMIGLVVGGLIGWLRPDWGNAVYLLKATEDSNRLRYFTSGSMSWLASFSNFHQRRAGTTHE